MGIYFAKSAHEIFFFFPLAGEEKIWYNSSSEQKIGESLYEKNPNNSSICNGFGDGRQCLRKDCIHV
jgi:hypothetical protein